VSDPDPMTDPGPNEGGLIADARALMAGLVAEPWGQMSASAYETGRLAALAPWLIGHERRVEYLVADQRADGGWGGPDGYGLVPTLSATDALLAEVRRAPDKRDRLIPPLTKGLSTLFRRLRDSGPVLPDMPAIELIVPSLVNSINQHLDQIGRSPLAGLDPWSGARLDMPAGMDDVPLRLISARVRSGGEVPEKLLHALEAVGPAARAARSVKPVGPGTIGASPAATAAWIGERPSDTSAIAARRYLEVAVARHQGPVPCGFPVGMFEQSWVISLLARSGIRLRAPRTLIASLGAATNPGGTPAGPGLPADADTTSVALYALALLGVPYEPMSLWSFETDSHFCTWQGEQGFSVTVNAHVLDAFGHYLATRPVESQRYTASADRLTALLREHQRADGSWLDRWHASPFYATACCCLSLDEFGGAASRAVLARTLRWVRDMQRPDGSWGLWYGTAEETAYALQILLMTRAAREEPWVPAVAVRGLARLALMEEGDDPPMWHDKDLYRPVSIARAAVLAVRHAAVRAGGWLRAKAEVSTLQ
jgi:halimadienyl-diphosphate synthase